MLASVAVRVFDQEGVVRAGLADRLLGSEPDPEVVWMQAERRGELGRVGGRDVER